MEPDNETSSRLICDDQTLYRLTLEDCVTLVQDLRRSPLPPHAREALTRLLLRLRYCIRATGWNGQTSHQSQAERLDQALNRESRPHLNPDREPDQPR